MSRVPHAVAIAVSVLLATASAHAEELERMRLVEFPFDEPVFYHPVDLLCRGDSVRAILNNGDGTIVTFDAGWNLLARFGRLGEGPGEMRAPTALIAWDDTLWAVTPQNLVGYTWTGEDLGTRRMPWGITSLRTHGDRLIGTWTGGSSGGPAAVIMTRTGDIVKTFGPRCAAGRTGDIAGFAACLGWNILPRRRGGYMLVNQFQGDVVVYANLNRTDGTRKHLGIGKGRMISATSYQSVINDVCADSTGGFWVLTYKIDGRSRLYRFDDSWNIVGQCALDPEIGQGAIRILPDGTLCHIEEDASRLHIFRRPSF